MLPHVHDDGLQDGVHKEHEGRKVPAGLQDRRLRGENIDGKVSHVSSRTVPGAAFSPDENEVGSYLRGCLKVCERTFGDGVPEPILFIGVDDDGAVGDEDGAFQEKRIVRKKNVERKKAVFAFSDVVAVDREDDARFVAAGDGCVVVKLTVQPDAIHAVFLRPADDVGEAAHVDDAAPILRSDADDGVRFEFVVKKDGAGQAHVALETGERFLEIFRVLFGLAREFFRLIHETHEAVYPIDVFKAQGIEAALLHALQHVLYGLIGGREARLVDGVSAHEEKDEADQQRVEENVFAVVKRSNSSVGHSRHLRSSGRRVQRNRIFSEC